jgi:hypothetical protein
MAYAHNHSCSFFEASHVYVHTYKGTCVVSTRFPNARADNSWLSYSTGHSRHSMFEKAHEEPKPHLFASDLAHRSFDKKKCIGRGYLLHR